MEASGGEPDVIGYDAGSGQFIFCDCSLESPPDAGASATTVEHGSHGRRNSRTGAPSRPLLLNVRTAAGRCPSHSIAPTKCSRLIACGSQRERWLTAESSWRMRS